MNLKCLIELLLEKEYIHNIRNEMYDGEIVHGLYEFEHIEIYNKIKDSEYNKDIIVIEKHRYQRNKFYIINIKNLEKGLIFTSDGKEEFGFRADKHGLYGVDPLNLMDIIANETRFDVLRLNTTNGQIYMDLCDTYLQEKRIKEEKEKEIEILDFLDKLP